MPKSRLSRHSRPRRNSIINDYYWLLIQVRYSSNCSIQFHSTKSSSFKWSGDSCEQVSAHRCRWGHWCVLIDEWSSTADRSLCNIALCAAQSIINAPCRSHCIHRQPNLTERKPASEPAASVLHRYMPVHTRLHRCHEAIGASRKHTGRVVESMRSLKRAMILMLFPERQFGNFNVHHYFWSRILF